jgi:hypothetical protein
MKRPRVDTAENMELGDIPGDFVNAIYYYDFAT